MSIKAKESAQIEKARKKIERKLQSAEKRVNPEALNKMGRLIQEQLKRHQADRVSLKKRHIIAFDENKHSAAVKSQFILNLMGSIKQEKSSKEHDLEGRITPVSDTAQQHTTHEHTRKTKR